MALKLIVSWRPHTAGRSLGLLLGMFVLGSSLPHGIRAAGASFSWQAVILTSSVLALAGAAMIAFLDDGPHFLQGGSRAKVRNFQALHAFRDPNFRASAFGYFGHQ